MITVIKLNDDDDDDDYGDDDDDDELIMTSFAKQFAYPKSFYDETWKTWYRRVFYKLLKSLTPSHCHKKASIETPR